MRTSGAFETAENFGIHDHLCCAYDDTTEFYARAAEFCRGGLDQGLRVCVVTNGDGASLHDAFADDPWLSGSLDDPAIHWVSAEQMYPAGWCADPMNQVRRYIAATEAALADGFSGLRVIAEATAAGRIPEQIEPLARYEHRVDRYMARHPLSALCGLRRAEVPPESVEQIASLHPVASPGAAQFHFYTNEEGVLAISGELDGEAAVAFALALRRAETAAPSGELVVDARGLTFLDHRNLSTLAALAARKEVTVLVRTGNPAVGRLIELLNVRGISVECKA
ncbi:hypothetical protein FNH05_16485 [Amycolatopsis rhizosphaerae]|uniref:STAS domain-containing protein n=1 Tax=Amycolatopsis rhizosphaerae TaxID=2053003 RepID=A0A558CM89_9PSEU|nr:MEDS domain-containing protein [Amycolatopsis rhizosphaerae]TVT49903.1 hypothetical protein FNH05_16485 [Amycolatopsis rhizosphaerae]